MWSGEEESKGLGRCREHFFRKPEADGSQVYRMMTILLQLGSTDQQGHFLRNALEGNFVVF